MGSLSTIDPPAIPPRPGTACMSPGGLAAEGAAERRRTEQILLLVLAAVQFTTIVDFVIIMPLGSQLMESLHLTPSKFGMIVASYTFAAGVAGLVTSSLIARY